MSQYWKAGESCALRGIVNHKVWLAQAMMVVRDSPDETVLLLLPGAHCAFPEGYWRWKMNRDYSQGTRWQEAKKESFVLREFNWHTNRLLMFLEPEKIYSCWMFWDQVSDRFSGYYINFQLPYHRSHCGFDTLDLDLDIVIDPEYNWEWKDTEDYREGIREGGIREKWVKEIEQSQPEIFDRIHRRSYPLDGSWLDWRPDPASVPPQLPPNWKIA